MNSGEDPRPWFAGEEAGLRKHAPATVRNRDPIADVLRSILPTSGTMLEIASGSGEHVVHFANIFPDLTWQPSDPDLACRASIAAWAERSGLPNILPPLDLDAAAPDWPIDRANAILCINMIHISPWIATLGLLDGASRLLCPDAPLYLYGPFFRSGTETASSNLAFDRSLRQRNPDWGLRDLDQLVDSAMERGFDRHRLIEMPANNLSIILLKRPDRRPGS